MNSKIYLGIFVALFLANSNAQAEPVCPNDVAMQAQDLLAFHLGENVAHDNFSNKIKMIEPIANPTNPQQLLQVFEIVGGVAEAQYRMRFMYEPMPDGSCRLKGQEILELVKFHEWRNNILINQKKK